MSEYHTKCVSQMFSFAWMNVTFSFTGEMWEEKQMGTARTREHRCVKYLDDLMRSDWSNTYVRLTEMGLIYPV